MAYVGISSELVNSVVSTMGKMQNTEQEAFVRPQQESTIKTATDDLVQLVWGKHIALKEMMPPEWLTKTNSLDIRHKIVHEGIETDARFTVRFDEPMLTPPGASSYRHDVYIGEDEWPALAAMIKYEKEMVEIKARWNKIKSQIVEFLKSCKSLNEALKLWPDVRIYIPKQYLERVERKVEREVKTSAAQQTLAGIDTDAAIAAATTARFMSNMTGVV